MKRFLTSLALLPLAAVAQVPEQELATDQGPVIHTPPVEQQNVKQGENPAVDQTLKDLHQQYKRRSQKAGVEFQSLDTTFYDLQSNASVGRRIKVYPDGRISAVWTHGLDDLNNYPDRGTGYNHFNGNEWVVGDVSRLENTRSGWPNIGTFGNNQNQNEFTITHIAGDAQEGTGGYVFSQNNEVGDTSFSNEIRQSGDGPIWWRTATSGDNLYMIGTYSGNSNLGGDTMRQGIRFPTVFYRSTDQGQTFVDSDILLPGYADTSERLFGSADAYAIDARDNYVAIVISQGNRSLTLWKSNDFGQTWNEKVIRKLNISTGRYRNGLWGLDTVANPDAGPPNEPDSIITLADTTNDGSVSTLIDETGTVHVSWGNRVAGRNDTTQQTGAFRFLTGPNMIQYWNDDEESIVNVGGAPTITSNVLGESNYVRGDRAPYSTSAASRPTIAHSSKDTLFIVYEAAVANTVKNNNDYRDLYVVFSTDGGASWSDSARNITQTAIENGESVFASANKSIVNNKLHLIWQEDISPGTSVGAQAVQATVTDNSILYAGIDVDLIFKDSLERDDDDDDNNTSANGAFNQQPNSIGELAVYPNPVRENDVITAQLTLQSSADVAYKVVNALGQVQYRENMGVVAAGKQDIRLNNLDLAKGVYFLQFNVDDQTVTKKILRQ